MVRDFRGYKEGVEVRVKEALMCSSVLIGACAWTADGLEEIWPNFWIARGAFDSSTSCRVCFWHREAVRGRREACLRP